MLNFGEDFQRHLDQPIAYWEDFGQRCAASLRQVASPLSVAQLEGVITRTLTQISSQTGKTLETTRAEAFAKGLREGYAQTGKIVVTDVERE